jgi:16S rRNA C967 or C1407 C5-methylase (RsmB/RsmF family)/NOL1/NOP2/fmu family ribosome biogenesis protein
MAKRRVDSRRRHVGPGAQAGVLPALPPDFVQAARTWLGDETDAFLTACAQPPRLAVRANALKGGLPALLRALGPTAATWPSVPWWPDALLPPPGEAAHLAAHPLARVGALYAQDSAALAAVAALDPQPGERVLDLCAAPGGKSTAIADRMAGRGPTGVCNTPLLVANDVDARRARDLEHTLERWGAAGAAVLALAPERLAALAPGFFDRVLVDAPCSGEAMFARHPHAAAAWSREHVAGCAARQQLLIESAWQLVRPGGVLLYATCTFNPVENEAVIARYLAAHVGDVLEDAARLLGASPGRPDLLMPAQAGPRGHELVRMARLWPHRGPGAGHSVALIRVAGDGTAQSPPPDARRLGRPVREADRSGEAVVRALAHAVAPGLELGGRVVVRGERAFLVPEALPVDLAEAAQAPGLRLAERRGRTWHPAHALAMALQPEQARGAVHLDDTAAATFLTGRPVAGPGEGLMLAAWHRYPLGWARARGGTLTPLLPTGLRTPLTSAPAVDVGSV